MEKSYMGRLSTRNVCAIIVCIHVSSAIILRASQAGTDTWIAYLLSTLAVVPLMLLYARLVHLMPGRDLFEMMSFVFGKGGGIVLSAIYACYFILLSSLVRNYYADFVHQAAFKNTSMIVILFAFFIICVYLAKSGTGTIGKWSALLTVMVVIVSLGMSVISIPDYNSANLRPVFSHSLSDISAVSLQLLIMPMGDAVIILSMADNLDRRANPYKGFAFGSLISIALLIVMFLRNCAILGEKILEIASFPSYKAASVVNVGPFGTRTESIIAIFIILTGVTKVACALYAGAKGVKRAFRLPTHRSIILSIGFFSIALSLIVFHNAVEMFEFVHIYHYFAIPFQIGVPLIVWIVAEIKIRTKKLPRVTVWKEAEAKAETKA